MSFKKAFQQFEAGRSSPNQGLGAATTMQKGNRHTLTLAWLKEPGQ
jgi:hypothetical protein